MVNFKYRDEKINTMKGLATDQIILIFIAIIVAGGLIYWFWTTWGKGTGAMNQQECQLSLSTSCTQYKGSGRPSEVRTSFLCKDNKPTACGCNGEFKDSPGWHEKELSVSSAAINWWDCIAPGCYKSFGIKIYSSADCD